jgi:pectate lyase
MGNSHGHHHRKHRFSVPNNTVPPPPYKYGGSGTSQIHNPPNNSNNNIMVSLPYANADVTLRSLAAQAEGFGRFATGGLHGSLYHVTSLLGKVKFSLLYLCINPQFIAFFYLFSY